MEEFDSAKIFKRYTGNRMFYADVFSICGNSLFINLIDKKLKLLQLFKMFRIFKLNNMIVTSNIKEEQKA